MFKSAQWAPSLNRICLQWSSASGLTYTSIVLRLFTTGLLNIWCNSIIIWNFSFCSVIKFVLTTTQKQSCNVTSTVRWNTESMMKTYIRANRTGRRFLAVTAAIHLQGLRSQSVVIRRNNWTFVSSEEFVTGPHKIFVIVLVSDCWQFAFGLWHIHAFGNGRSTVQRISGIPLTALDHPSAVWPFILHTLLFGCSKLSHTAPSINIKWR